MKSVRIVSLFLAVVTAAAVLVACVSPPPDEGTTQTTVPQQTGNEAPVDTAPEETTSENNISHLPDTKFENYNYNVLARSGDTTAWATLEIQSDGMTGELINDAVYTRNTLLLDKYGVNLIMIGAVNNDLIPKVRSASLAQTNEYDVYLMNMQKTSTLASEGLLYDWNKLEYLDMQKPWWDSYVASQSTIGNYLFFAMGDANIVDNYATWGVLFNKNLAGQYELPDLYKAVDEKKWTVDMLEKYAVDVTGDLNSDGKLTPEDRWGCVDQYETVLALYIAFGGATTQKDADDYPQLILEEDKMQAKLDRVLKYHANDQIHIRYDDYSGKYSDIYTTFENIFAQGRGLFYITPFANLRKATLINMPEEYGVLPLPLMDESQEQYLNTLQYNNATVFSIPSISSDISRTEIVLDAMGFYSKQHVTEAFYEISLKLRKAKDEQSSNMLDLIFGTRVVDTGFLYNWASLQSLYQNLAKNKSTGFSTMYRGYSKAIVKAMEQTVKEFSAQK